MRFVPCPACARHVRRDERACPFCAVALPSDLGAEPRARPRFVRAAVVVAGTLALAGCQRDDKPTEIGADDRTKAKSVDGGSVAQAPSSSSTSSSAAPSTSGPLKPGLSDEVMVAVYGGPPVAAYGAPPVVAPSGSASIGAFPGSSDDALVVARNRFRVRACYERELKVDPSAGGTMNVKIEIASSGEVTSSKPESVLLSKSLAACAAAAFGSAVFSAGAARTLVVPLTFKTKP